MDKIIATLNESTGNKVRPTDSSSVFVVSDTAIDEAFSEEKSDDSKLVFADEIVAYGINGPIKFTLFGLRDELSDESSRSVSGNSAAFKYSMMQMTDPDDGFASEDDVYIFENQTGENSLPRDVIALIDKRTNLLREKKSSLLTAGALMTQMLSGKPDAALYSHPDEE